MLITYRHFCIFFILTIWVKALITMALTYIVGGDFEMGLDRTKIFVRDVKFNGLVNDNKL
ncbi:hypothetical protein ACJDU8_10800 [Clostridium sp. WILCCON 0269]|uniref:Uncharacterized protein n=1 Tax=Candidatus Clostridium eludens TaxID=3381663 RepID=A0ABW8SJJ1_9CLOT